MGIRIFALIFLVFASCKKFIDAKPNNSLKVPVTLADCQALLDDDRVMNGFGNSGYPYMPVVGSDDYYATGDQYSAYSPTDQQAVIWAREIPTGDEFPDWDLPYRVVFTSNQVLETISKLSPDDQPATWKNIKGSAHFFRALAFFQLSQVFAPAYDSVTAMYDKGIPLRMSTDVNETLFRASVQQTYDQILNDLRMARSLLQPDPNRVPTRPSLAAVYALCCRVYLSARNYPMALQYADSCLQLQSTLMRFDTVSTTALFPFTRWNPEVIFDAAYFSSGPAATYRSHVDSNLYRSYQAGDLRKDLFLDGMTSRDIAMRAFQSRKYYFQGASAWQGPAILRQP
jgi:hypothetical protein